MIGKISQIIFCFADMLEMDHRKENVWLTK